MTKQAYTVEDVREAIERALLEWGFESLLDTADEVNHTLNAGEILNDILRELTGQDSGA